MTALPRETPRPAQVDRPVSSGALVAAVGTAFVIAGVLSARGREPNEVALAAVFGGLLVALAWTDLRSRVIPNRVVYPALMLAILASAAWPGRGPAETLAGGAGAFASFAIVRAVCRSALGGGDVKMAALAGMVVGWGALVPAAIVMAASGGFVAAAFLVAGRSRTTERMPYGVFIAVGGMSSTVM